MRAVRFTRWWVVMGCAGLATPALAQPRSPAPDPSVPAATRAPAAPRADLAPSSAPVPASAAPITSRAPAAAGTPSAPALSAPDASRRDTARRLGAAGLAAFDEHAYLTAIERLTEALAFHDAPTLRLYRARALGRLGRWVAACEDYDAILRSHAEASESSVVVQARDAASQEGKDACMRIAKLRLVDLAGEAVVVRLDGALWPSKQLDRVRYLDPGPHAIERVHPSEGTRRRALSIAAGDTMTLSLRSLEPVAHASVDAELVRFLAERPRSAEREPDPRDALASPSAARAEGPPSRERLRVEFSPLGSMYRHTHFSGRAFDAFEQGAVGMVGRLGFEWSPLPERTRDWFGVGASWVQDFGGGGFHYSQSLGFVSTHYAVGRWRFGARLGLGFVQSGVELLDQRFALMEPALDADVRFGKLAIDATCGFIAPVGYTDHSIYSNLSGYGLEGRVTLDYPIWRWLGVQLSAALNRFDYELDSPDIVSLDGVAPPREMTVLELYASAYLGLSASL